MSFSATQVILLTINVNFLIFGFFLIFNQKGNSDANKLIGILMILDAYVNTHFVFLYDKQVYLEFPHLIGTHMPFLFLIPPFIFFYYQSVFNTSFNFSIRKLPHLIPAVVILLLYLPLYFSSVKYKENFIATGECFFPYQIITIVFFLYFTGYLLAIMLKINGVIKSSKDRLNTHLITYYKGARLLILSLLAILFIAVALNLNLIFVPILTSVIYYYILYLIFTQPNIFFVCKFAKSELKKNKTTLLSAELVEQIFIQTDLHLNSSKSFLNLKLTLPELAYQINVPVHHLSYVINYKSGLNFNDFINKYRSEYCKKILLDNDYSQYTMEAIGKISGFRTRQTFIKSFKKFYALTPSEYLKKNS